MSEHAQKAVKVNVLADVGIAKLVEAFSEIPNVQTTGSCQGAETAFAFVEFCLTEGNGRNLPMICRKLVEEIADEIQPGWGVSIKVEWDQLQYINPSATFACPPKEIGHWVNQIQKAAEDKRKWLALQNPGSREDAFKG